MIVDSNRIVPSPRVLVGSFFALVLCAIGISIACDAPLSYDGAFFFFSALDHHSFAAFHGRNINMLQQIPMFAVFRLTQNVHLLRIAYGAGYASVPGVCLGASWLLCRRRNPSLFIWPAMAICLASLPGQFSFHSEAIVATTLMWPALLTILVDGPWLLYVMFVAAAIESHPGAILPLAFTIAIAIAFARLRPQSRRTLVSIAAVGALLGVARSFMPLDPYELNTLSLHSVRFTFKVAVFGWPLIAVGFLWLAAAACLGSDRRLARRVMMASIFASGVALVIWACHREDWWKAADFRYWASPVSMILMACATFESWWPRAAEKPSLRVRFAALPVIGAIFFAVLAIQGLQWEQMSQRLTHELVSSGRGCLPLSAVPWMRRTALDHWSVTVYAIDLQGRQPTTLLLPDDRACQTFEQTGDALLAKSGKWEQVRRRGDGWFDLDAARATTTSSTADASDPSAQPQSGR